MNKLRLGVNIDHVATVRNARGGRHPDPVRAAFLAVQAGADGITAHLREDRRHISDADIDALVDRLTVPLNLEMALKMGDEIGVVPQMETWGPSANLHLLGEALYVIAESGHPKACLLPDVYHTYKGGSDFDAYKVISGCTIQVFHLNDYPADPSRDRIGDGDRVMPGDGIAPIPQILRDVYDNGCRAMLSLELFNRDYWKQDALEVAKLGLSKMKAVVKKALK